MRKWPCGCNVERNKAGNLDIQRCCDHVGGPLGADEWGDKEYSPGMAYELALGDGEAERNRLGTQAMKLEAELKSLKADYGCLKADYDRVQELGAEWQVKAQEAEKRAVEAEAECAVLREALDRQFLSGETVPIESYGDPERL